MTEGGRDKAASRDVDENQKLWQQFCFIRFLSFLIKLYNNLYRYGRRVKWLPEKQACQIFALDIDHDQ